MVPDWLSQLLAALGGAGIGALALWLVFLAEQRNRRRDMIERYEERFEAALASLMAAMWEFAEANLQWFHSRRFGTFRSLKSEAPIESPPNTAAIMGQLEIVRMIASATDRPVTDALARLIEPSVDLPAEELKEAMSAAGMTIRWWRTGERSHEETVRLLKATESNVRYQLSPQEDSVDE